MNEVHEFLAIFKHAVLAAMGGVVREILTKPPEFQTPWEKFLRFLAGAAVGTFTGVLVYFGCKHLGAGEYLTACCVGLGGYVGAPILDAGGRRLRKFVDKRNEGNP